MESYLESRHLPLQKLAQSKRFAYPTLLIAALAPLAMTIGILSMLRRSRNISADS